MSWVWVVNFLSLLYIFPMKTIDLRSDTVTRPSDGMYEAMRVAEVGDDVLGDDPTVKLLQQKVASLFDREDALYVPSGTMANQIALKVSSQPGWELLCDRECHVVNYEVAGPVVHSSLLINLLTTDRGMVTAEMVRQSIRPINLHCPLTKMVTLENTHNRHGGTILPQEEIISVRQVCDEFGLHLHLDGARIWNAHVATGIPLSELTRPFHTISVCLSKGLGAPIGSVIVGTKEFISKCLRERKLFGGGMRQVGFLAAAGLYALENNIDRLKEDHANARMLAEELSTFDCFEIDLSRVETNIVIIDLVNDMTADELLTKINNVGVLAVPFGPKRIRMVTHLDLSAEDCRDAIERLRSVLS